MAFDIQRATRSLPSKPLSTTGDTSVNLGGGGWGGVGKFGQGLMSLTYQLNEIEAENQFDEKARVYEEEYTKFIAGISAIPDLSHEEYQQRFDEFHSSMKKNAPKNPKAKKGYDRFLAEQRTRGSKKIAEYALRRQRDQYNSGVMHDIAMGFYDKAEKKVNENKYNTFTPQEQQRILDDVIPKAQTQDQYETAMAMATRDPDTFMNFVRDDHTIDPALGFDKLDIGHGKALKNIAMGAQRERQAKINLKAAEDQENIYNAARADNANVEAIFKSVENLKWADGKEKMQIEKNVLEILKWKAEQANIMSGKVSADEKDTDSQALMSEMDDYFDDYYQEQSSEDKMVTKKNIRDAQIKSRMMYREKVKPEMTYEDKIRLMLDTQRIVQQQLTDPNVEFEVFDPVQPPNAKTNDPFFDSVLPYLVATRMTQAMNKNKKTETIPTVKTKEDLDKLKSGDQFYAPNGELRRKK